MPTYQYACTNPECGNRFELVQAFTDPAASACPVCEQRVRKVYGSVGVVFKGSGFYRTDSRSENRPAASRGSESTDKPATKDTASKSSPNGASSGSSSASSGGSSGSSSASKAPAAAAAS